MKLNNHYDLVGKHAILSPSTWRWIHYPPEKLESVYRGKLAVLRGTELHKLAELCIRNKQKLPRSKKTLNMYVNDSINYNMTPEQPLYYSENCFGTADALSFKNNFLRIHDYKSGETPAHMDQLLIYAGLFCLEYRIKPAEIKVELRIYQSDEAVICNPTVEDLAFVMDGIISCDKIIRRLKEESD